MWLNQYMNCTITAICPYLCPFITIIPNSYAHSRLSDMHYSNIWYQLIPILQYEDVIMLSISHLYLFYITK
jgi:hypothetical protein